ncbi:DUF4476 domain-containing protein [Fluviicola sp. SGL-29]|nr:DUF4476 domain-containing protein [Fluviicola sp. SGL-29]
MRTIFTFAITFVLCFTSVASELFIRVNATGEYSVTVYDQTHQNRNNVYQFAGLPGGITSVMIVNKHTNTLLYNGTLSLMQNERVIVQVNGFGNLSILQRVPIQEVNWYTTVVANDPYAGTWPGTTWPGTPNPGNPYPGYPYPNGPYPGGNFPGQTVGNTSSYHLFLNTLRNEAMDSNKLRMAKNYVASNSLTAEQIAGISKEFSFDNNRLDFAKHAYASCYDKNNYFLLKDTFTFSSNYNNLLNHIGG